MIRDELGKRMKENYEMRSRTYLTRRTPVIIRLDGKAFHSFTRGFNKPYDRLLMKTMQETMKALCSSIQGCVLGYTQSDEISLLLIDFKSLGSDAWVDYRVDKMCSIAASIATFNFNKIFNDLFMGIEPPLIGEYSDISILSEEELAEDFSCEVKLIKELELYELARKDKVGYKELCDIYYKALNKGALFDARCFNIPASEVTNYFLWRQEDASINSIQMLGQHYFTQKELQGKNCNQIQDMMFTKYGINWNDLDTVIKRGSCCKREEIKLLGLGREVIRHNWIIDKEIPIFIGDGREYIDDIILQYVDNLDR